MQHINIYPNIFGVFFAQQRRWRKTREKVPFFSPSVGGRHHVHFRVAQLQKLKWKKVKKKIFFN